MKHQLKEEIEDNLEPNVTQETSKNILGFDVINIKKEKDETNFESNTATAFDRVEEHKSEKQSTKIKSPISCEICHRSFGRTSTLKLHMNLHTREKMFKCSECNKEFIQKHGLKRHWLQVHNNEKLKAVIEKPHKCEHCGKKFLERYMLINHTRVHTDEKPFECSKCGKKYALKVSLKVHMQTHMKKIKKPIPCEICHKSYAGRGVLKLHMNTHTRREKLYKCSECNKEFLWNQGLKRHWLRHHKIEKSKAAIEKPHKCEHCGKKFMHRRSLIIHTRVHTGEKPFECSKCDKKFASKGVMKVHAETHMKKIKKPIPCEICHKSYAGRGILKLHMNIHTREKVFKCSECNKEFLWKLGLKRHWLRVHKKEKLKASIEKSHQCDHCGKKYMHRNNLITHTKVHTGERPFECSMCDKKFARKHVMKVHMQTHMPKIKKEAIEKPHKCEHCDKKFVERRLLISHTRVHTGERPFECSKCGKKYTSKAIMKVHMQTHMKKIKKEIPHSNSGEIAMLSTDDSTGEIKSEFKTIKAEKIDVVKIAITESTDTEEKAKPAADGKGSSHLPYKSDFGETICKEEVILPDENLN